MLENEGIGKEMRVMVGEHSAAFRINERPL